MSVTAIVGADWGDEGKGKLTAYLADMSDIVVRFQGGDNAGHLILNKYGRTELTLLPAGVFNPNVLNVIGNGVALNVPTFVRELNDLSSKGVPAPDIAISDRAQVLLEYHAAFDDYEEDRLGSLQYGSSRHGMAPFYSDKHYKIGVQVNELFDLPALKERLAMSLHIKNTLLTNLYRKSQLSLSSVMEQLEAYAEVLKPYVTDTSLLLNKALKSGKRILLEGQLGALRDIDHGLYPYSTSSSTLAGAASTGAGIPPYVITNIIAVTRAYASSVGTGPFISGIEDYETAKNISIASDEPLEPEHFTNRMRQVGWFDVVATSYGCMLQGATELAISHLDAMSGLDDIYVCTAYDIDGVSVTNLPPTNMMKRARPVLVKMPGWKTDIKAVRSFDELPRNAKAYVRFLSQSVGVPLRWISVGARREEMIRV